MENGLVKTIVEEPMEVILPDYFHKPGRRQQVVQNNQNGFDFYTAQKPVQPQSSKTQ